MSALILLIGAGAIGLSILWYWRNKANRPPPPPSDPDTDGSDPGPKSTWKKMEENRFLSTALVAFTLIGAVFFLLYFYFPGIWNVYWDDKPFFFGSLLAFAAIATFWVEGMNPKLKGPARVISSIIAIVLLFAIVERKWDFSRQIDWADLDCRPGTITKQIPREKYGQWYIRIAKAGDSSTFTVPSGGASISWKPCGRVNGLSYTVSVLPRHTDTWMGPFKYFPGMTNRPDLGLYRQWRFEAPDLPSGRVYTLLVSLGPYRGE